MKAILSLAAIPLLALPFVAAPAPAQDLRFCRALGGEARSRCTSAWLARAMRPTGPPDDYRARLRRYVCAGRQLEAMGAGTLTERIARRAGRTEAKVLGAMVQFLGERAVSQYFCDGLR